MFKKITIKEITMTALAVSLVTISKLFDNFMPKINGYSMFEFWMPISILLSLLLPIRSATLMVVTVPLLWFAFGQTIIVGPLSFIMDYQAVMILPLLINISNSGKSFFSYLWLIVLTTIIFIIKWLLQTISGVINWETPWQASASFNLPFNAITYGLTVPMIILLFSKITFLRSALFGKNRTKKLIATEQLIFNKNLKWWNILFIRKIHNGYTNTSFKFYTTNGNYQVRIPKQKIVDWDKEALSYLSTNNNVVITSEGILIKKWIKGTHKKNLNIHQQNNLISEIDKLHKIKKKLPESWDWNRYIDYANKINKKDMDWYKAKVQKYKKDKLVFSHTDLNTKNFLVNGNNITLIDLEWSAMAPEYLDYAIIWSTCNVINKNLDLEKLNDYKRMYEIFSLMWAFSMPETRQIKRLRIDLQNTINNI